MAEPCMHTKHIERLLMYYLGDGGESPLEEVSRVNNFETQARVELGTFAVNQWMDEMLGRYRESTVEKIGAIDNGEERERSMLDAGRNMVDNIGREALARSSREA
ncbi:hypothetical protein IAR50_003201 [Cryptococcus sp. DSM 104548]